MARTQGNKANSSGNVLEQTVISTLTAKGFTTILYKDWIKAPNIYGTELLLKNAPYTTIYNHRGTTEFLLKSQNYNLEIRIECKWQQNSGSVDEKFPYLYLNCIESMPEQNIIIVIDGDGYKNGALEWLKEAVNTRKYQQHTQKDIKVLKLTEFIIWANKIF